MPTFNQNISKIDKKSEHNENINIDTNIDWDGFLAEITDNTKEPEKMMQKKNGEKEKIKDKKEDKKDKSQRPKEPNIRDSQNPENDTDAFGYPMGPLPSGYKRRAPETQIQQIMREMKEVKYT